MAKLRAIFVFVCFSGVAIGPLNIMQLVAWGSMLQDYSEDHTLSQAAEMTFSGEYPCEMCRKIAEARQNESQPEQPAPRPAEDLSSLRLHFSFSEPLSATAAKWLTSPVISPGKRSRLSPTSPFLRIPTPPPRLPLA